MIQINKALSETKGRFFGITKKDGTRLNAKLVKLTEHYAIVSEQNMGKTVKISKNNISQITMDGLVIR